MDTYLDLAWVLLAHADDAAVDLQRDGLGEGHGFAASVVVLHFDGERDQFGVLGAEGCELVDAGALEVVPQPVEGGVVRVARRDAGHVLGGPARGDAVGHRAFLVGLAPDLLTNQGPPRLAAAPALAPVLPELLLRPVGAAAVGAAAGLHRDARGVGEDEAVVAAAARRARLPAGPGGFGVGAGGGARCPTGFKVAVLGTSRSCGGDIWEDLTKNDGLHEG